MYGRIVSRLTERVFDKSVWEGVHGGERAEPKDALRAVLLIVLFALTFAAGMVATFLKGEWARSHILSFVSCIGGGVFLGACLLDLLPDSIESFEKTKLATDFPVPLAFVAVGFLLVLSIDQVVKAARERNVFGNVGYHIHSHDHEQRLEEREHLHGEGGDEEVAQSGIGVAMLVLALSVHALFEGLSLAVTSDASQLLQIFGALILHKCIMGFCLGVRLVQANLTTPWIALAQFLFSVQVLIGGLAGIGIMKFISGGEQSFAAIVSSVLQAIACGTFLYITTFEVIPHELHNGKFRVLKTLFIYFGFGIVVAFILIFPEAS
ncbi:hypothetical protein CRE_20683 [Caenorhabditis remanei]|uniref:Uncharacterized protein n=2 Tax=Caenorhabditis remanei TaxID=31234 RepID=E3MFB9_CAERE|nr:hypothetical protein CRE_20683 [Caenorhabditis remanei]